MKIKLWREELHQGKTIYDLPLRVAYYARVSTDKDDQLNSLANQRKYFIDLINSNYAWNLAGEYIDEGISGTSVKHRHQFLKMLDDAAKGQIDLILTKEISRFSRNTLDSIQYTQYLLKHEVIVFFLSDNLHTLQEDAEFRLTIMASLAQDEVRKLSERVKFGIRRMIKDHKVMGNQLTGYYKNQGKLTINPHEAQMIQYLFQTYASGKVSLKEISAALAQQGFVNSNGQNYSYTSLAKMLKNPRYKGYYTANLSEVIDYKTHQVRSLPENEHIIIKDENIPAIVSEELWDYVNALYRQRTKALHAHVVNNQKHLTKYKYTNLIYCADCHQAFLRSAGSTRRNDPVWQCVTYKRQGVHACASPQLKESLIDKVIGQSIFSLLPDFATLKSEIIADYQAININQPNNVPISSMQDKLLDLYLRNVIDEKTYITKTTQLSGNTYALNQPIEHIHQKEFLTYLDTLTKDQCLINLIPLVIKKIDIVKINQSRHNILLTINYQLPISPQTYCLDLKNKKIM